MTRMQLFFVAVLCTLIVVSTGVGAYVIIQSQQRVIAAERERDRLRARVAELEDQPALADAPSSERLAERPQTALFVHAANAFRVLDVQLRNTANNLANVNTPGFKASRVLLEDVAYEQDPVDHGVNADEPPTATTTPTGYGVRIAGRRMDFSPGPIKTTGRPLDVAIEGDGLFQVRTLHQGEEVTAYTRAGSFTRNADGDLVLASSDSPPVEPAIEIPDDAPNIVIARDGRIAVRSTDAELVAIGQLELARFVNPEGLVRIGRNLFVETEASGPPITGDPGEDGLGTLLAGAVEMSNVNPAQEQVEMIAAQSAYELQLRLADGPGGWAAMGSPRPERVQVPAAASRQP